mgnify:CR=1 FL=1
MSGCADVCLDHNYDDENEFYAEHVVTARKPHACCECGVTIKKGEQYELVRGKANGSFWVSKTCRICRADGEFGRVTCIDGAAFGAFLRGESLVPPSASGPSAEKEI